MRVTIIYLLMTFFSATLLAQSAEDAVNLLEDEQGFGLRATALGNAYIALADDYSGIYYNPAGLARVKIGQFSASLSNLNQQTNADFLGSSFSDNVSSTKFQSLGVVFPFPVTRGSFVMALGYQKIKDYENYLKLNGNRQENNGLDFLIDDNYYGFDEQLHQKSTTDSEGNLSQWSFGLAMDFSANFSAGLSLNIYSGNRNDNFEYSQDTLSSVNTWFMDYPNSYPQLSFVYYDLNQKLKSEFSGFDMKLGGLFNIIPEHLKVGANITIPVYFKVEEKWSASDDLWYDIIDSIGPPDQISSPYSESGNFDYLIKRPFKFDVGAAYNYSIFLISASIDYCDWSQLKYDVPDGRSQSDYTDLLNQNNSFKNDFKAVTTVSVGAELSLLQDRLKLRGGFRNVPSPLKELGADYNKRYFSTGFGYQVDKNTLIQLTYVRGSWKRDKYYYYDVFDDNGAEPLVTSEDYVTSKILFGAQFNFR